jgi:ABC-type nitrate/sulfonate/bicarbonate transport system permease component
METPMNPIAVALVYLLVSALVLPLGFKLFKTNFDWQDIAMASGGAALSSLIPTIGSPLSLVISVAILYWRLGRNALFPDIIASVAVSRLAMLPLLLVLAKHN